MEHRPCIAVAYSAGRDSTALLHATVRAAIELNIDVAALHVHHGLSVHADAWLEHGRVQCTRWAAEGWPVRFMARRLEGKPARGESIEAWAREARYRALAEMARQSGASIVLLAHHLRDQAETWLLQALRGAGVAGLASMPICIEREGLTWARPWLGKSWHSIEAYVQQHRLGHVDDDSNNDPCFSRNRLRIEVWPALIRAFPGAEFNLAQAATWAQQAANCLDEIGAQDLAQITAPGCSLDVQAWLQLSPARRGNVLRTWLRLLMGGKGGTPPASLVMRLQRELGAGSGLARWQVPGGMLRRYRGQLFFVADPVSVVPGMSPAPETTLSIRRAGRYPLPGWQGTLHARRVKEGGIPLAWMAHLELRPRRGGERFQAGFERPARSLKKQYQSAGLPPWARQGPLVYSGGQLLFAPGLGMDARVMGMPGQAQMSLHWIGAPDLGGLFEGESPPSAKIDGLAQA